MKEQHEKWLAERLAAMAPAFPAYNLPTMARDEGDTTQAAVLRDLQTAAEMREVANGIVTERMADAQAAVDALRDKISGLHDLIAAGKAALMADKPVKPECGVAGYLLPDLEKQLAEAEAAFSAVERERNGLLSDANQRETRAETTLADLLRARRVQRIETLLRLAMDEATVLADDEGGKGRYKATIQIDNRVKAVANHGGGIEILRTQRGVNI